MDKFLLWFPRSCVGTHTEFEFAHPMHFHAGAWERGNKIRLASTYNTVATPLNNAQPWRLSIIKDGLSTIDKWVVGTYSYITTHPLQGYSFNCCSGRKNRLFGGFFICGEGKMP